MKTKFLLFIISCFALLQAQAQQTKKESLILTCSKEKILEFKNIQELLSDADTTKDYSKYTIVSFFLITNLENLDLSKYANGDKWSEEQKILIKKTYKYKKHRYYIENIVATQEGQTEKIKLPDVLIIGQDKK
ncbi:MAG: hypothetical protein V1781_09810 [Bacteroidota bacterium]